MRFGRYISRDCNWFNPTAGRKRNTKIDQLHKVFWELLSNQKTWLRDRRIAAESPGSIYIAASGKIWVFRIAPSD